MTKIKKLNITDTIFNNDIDKICQMFPKLAHVSLSLKEYEDILRIFNGFHDLTSATICWKNPRKTFSAVINDYLQQNNMCTDGTYRSQTFSLHVLID